MQAAIYSNCAAVLKHAAAAKLLKVGNSATPQAASLPLRLAKPKAAAVLPEPLAGKRKREDGDAQCSLDSTPEGKPVVTAPLQRQKCHSEAGLADGQAKVQLGAKMPSMQQTTSEEAAETAAAKPSGAPKEDRVVRADAAARPCSCPLDIGSHRQPEAAKAEQDLLRSVSAEMGKADKSPAQERPPYGQASQMQVQGSSRDCVPAVRPAEFAVQETWGGQASSEASVSLNKGLSYRDMAAAQDAAIMRALSQMEPPPAAPLASVAGQNLALQGAMTMGHGNFGSRRKGVKKGGGGRPKGHKKGRRR